MKTSLILPKQPTLHIKFAFLSCLIFAVCQSMFFSIFPFLAADIGIDLAEVVFVFAVGSALFLVSAPLWTSLSEIFGRVRISLVCLFGLAMSLILLYIAITPNEVGIDNIFALWASRIVYGIFAAGIVPIAATIYAHEPKGRLLTRFANHAQGTTIGRIVGPIIGLTATYSGINLIVAILALLVLSVVVLGFFVEDVRPEFCTVLKFVKEIPKINGIPILIWAVIAVSFVTTGVQSSLAGFLQFEISSDATLPFVNSLCFVLGNVIMTINQKFMDRSSLPILVRIGCFSLILSCGALAVSTDWPMILAAYCVFCLAISNLRVGFMTLFCNKNPGKKGCVVVAFSLVQTVGYALGNFYVSWSLDSGFMILFCGLFVISFFLIPILITEFFYEGSSVAFEK